MRRHPSDRTSFGYDLVVWHQDCPWLGDRDVPSPRFVPTARAEHRVGEHCRSAPENRDSGGVSLFCERCPAWIHVGVRMARPGGKGY